MISKLITHDQNRVFVYGTSNQARIQDFGRGGAWGVGDKLAVRSSQVCAPGGSEGMPPRNFSMHFPAIWCILGGSHLCLFLPIFCR